MDFLPGITELYLAAEASLEFTPLFPVTEKSIRSRKVNHQMQKGFLYD